MEVMKQYMTRSGIICNAIASSVMCGTSLYKAVTILGEFSGGIKNILHPIQSTIRDSEDNKPILYLTETKALEDAIVELDSIMNRYGFLEVKDGQRRMAG